MRTWAFTALLVFAGCRTVPVVEREPPAMSAQLRDAASMHGRYDGLVAVFEVADDAARYGEHHDYGYWQGGDYQGIKDTPAGFWVYVAPRWYVWERLAPVPAQAAPPSAAVAPAAPTPAAPGDDAPGRCKETDSNAVLCGDQRFNALQVMEAGDGTFRSVQWTEYFEDDAHWRTVKLGESGSVSATVDDGTGRQSRWWGHYGWNFPRTQRLTIRSLGGLKVAVTDATGREWVLEETHRPRRSASISIVSVGGQPAAAAPLAKTELGVLGVDLTAGHAFTLVHRSPSYDALAKRDTPAFYETKSTFVDRHGRRCEVANRELFGTRPDGKGTDFGMRLNTDQEVAELLAQRCKELDLAPLRSARPPAPATEASHER